MKSFYLLKFILLSLGIFSINGIYSQHEIYKQVKEFRLVQGSAAKSTDLFSRQPNSLRSAKVTQAVRKSTLLKLNSAELGNLYNAKNSKLDLRLPYDMGFLELELMRAELFTPDFKVVTSASNGQGVPIKSGIYYRGFVKNDSNSLVTISIFQDDVVGIIASENGNIVLGNYDKTKKDEFVIYNDQDLTEPFNFDCQTPEVEPGSRLAEEIRKLSTQKSLESRANKCIRMYFELDFTLVTEKGGVQGAVNWFTGAFTQMQALYANDGISISISEIFVWVSEDPYNDATTFGGLDRFRTTRPIYNGDLAHLISRGAPTGGGIAYLNTLCTDYGYAYSWVRSYYYDFPTYSWTVNVMAHETGHNLGSPHTHNCAWEGGPIDGCGPTYNAGYVEGSCPTGPIPTGGGTMMSYCHLVSTGIDLNKGFGPLPLNLITNRINEATCLNASCILNVGIPTNITATDGVYTDKVNIIWSGTSGHYFQVYRNMVDNNSTATALGSWQSGTSYEDLTAIASQTYFYWVRAAFNSSGDNVSDFAGPETGWRSEVAANLPSSISASDGTFTDKVSLSWSGTSGNYFQVYRNTTNTSSTAVILGSWQPGTSYEDLTATANITYYYWVRAATDNSGANASAYAGPETGWRNSITVTVPGAVSATDGTYSDKVIVTWTGTSGNYFRVYRHTSNSSGSATALGSWQLGSSYDDLTAVVNQTYYYWVLAASDNSGSNLSSFGATNTGWRAATTVTVPTAVSATDGLYTDKVIITWSGTSGNYFRVYRNTSNSSGTASALGTWQSGLSYEDLNATPNQTYYYWVRAASNNSGSNISSYSASNSGWRKPVTVTKPLSVAASDGTYTDKITITWSGSAGNYFRVYRKISNNSSNATALGSWLTSTSFNDLTATSGTTYYYWVRAASNNSGANISNFSNSNSGWRASSAASVAKSIALDTDESSLSIFPNPVNSSSEFKILYITPDQSETRINIVDVSGKLFGTYKITSNPGENMIKLDAPTTAGNYILMMARNDGGSLIKKLIVQ